jgi:hypothetical protein
MPFSALAFVSYPWLAAIISPFGSQEAHAEVLDQCDFELAVAHLRVPEMA